MRIFSGAAVGAAITAFIATLLICPGTPSAQTPTQCYAAGSTPNCPVIETVLQLTSDSTTPQFVYTNGYFSAADGGGGVLYARQAPAITCTSTKNGGTIVLDSAIGITAVCYYAQTFPKSVMQWGALCDATNSSTPGAIQNVNGSIDFVAPGNLLLGSGVQFPIANGQSIAITGAGSSSGGTLASAVMGSPTSPNGLAPHATSTAGLNYVNVDTGSSATGIYPGMKLSESGNAFPNGTIVIAVNLNSSPQTISMSEAASNGVDEKMTFTGTEIPLYGSPAIFVPSWVATTVSSTAAGTSQHTYNVGDTLTLKDNGNMPGTLVQVLSLTSNGNYNYPNTVKVVQQAVLSFQPSNDTTVDNFGASYTLSYSSNGQFWYGDDDYNAIQTALNVSAAGPQTGIAPPSDIYIPANRACGVGNVSNLISSETIQLPQGVESLRGYGASSSTIVALGPTVPSPPPPHSYLLLRPNNSSNNAGGNGGGARGTVCAFQVFSLLCTAPLYRSAWWKN